jgi:hypothetical protein
MTSDTVKALVDREIFEWCPPAVSPGSAAGVPWDAARDAAYIAKLRNALVTPVSRERIAMHVPTIIGVNDEAICGKF